MSDGTHTTFCRICEASCGLQVTVENNRVTQIHPDRAHVATAGFSCPKGLKQAQMYDSPDRLKYPMKRVGTKWLRVSWEQALEEIGAKVKQLRGDHGADSLAMYVGTAAGFGVLHPVFAQGFMTAMGSKSMYASATQDCSNKFAVAREVYGFPFTQPFPDLDHTRCLIIVGANPVISKWSFLQVPNPGRALQQLRERGGKLIVVDPRKTETAKLADQHLFIRPNTDPFFYLSFLHELDRQGGVRRDRAGAMADGHRRGARAGPRLARRSAPSPSPTFPRKRSASWSPPSAPPTARRCTRPPASTWAPTARSGSGCRSASTSSPATSIAAAAPWWARGSSTSPPSGRRTACWCATTSRASASSPRSTTRSPAACWPTRSSRPGDKQVRALFVTGGNPLITMANSGRLKKAFEELELLVTLDLFRNETGSVAHYVLPCTSPLERPDLPFIFPLMLGLQRKPYLQATRAVVEPDGEQRDEATIYLQLCKAAGVGLFGSTIAQKLLEGMMAVHTRLQPKGKQPSLPQEALLSMLLRITGQPGFEHLLEHSPHGWLREAQRARRLREGSRAHREQEGAARAARS